MHNVYIYVYNISKSYAQTKKKIKWIIKAGEKRVLEMVSLKGHLRKNDALPFNS